jgi:hypothetical protein
MTTMVTKERAQELLAAATPGPWEAGAVRVYATAGCPRHAPNADALRGTHCRCRTVTMDAADADRALIAAAPDLAATVVAQADELARMRTAVAAEREAQVENAAAMLEWQEVDIDSPALSPTTKRTEVAGAALRDARRVLRAALDALLDGTTPAALAPAGGVAAAPTDPVDALNAAVTAAILRAERLAREGADATAAYADVARYEAALAALHPADTVEGQIAREGVALATGAAAVVRAAEGARR